MQNPRNERSFLVISSYVIGFVSAYILFGLGNSTQTSLDSQILATNNPTPKHDQVDLNNSDFIYTKPFALISPTRSNVFFCENEDINTNFCYGYIYNVATAKINNVYIDGELLTISKDLVKLIRWSNESLVIERMVSVNPLTPWLLTSYRTSS